MTERSAAGKRRARNERGLRMLPDGRWVASWYDGPRYIRRIFRTKGEARQAREAVRTHKAEGTYLQKRKEVTFEEAAKLFLKWSQSSLRATSRQTDRRMIKEWLACPQFAGKTLDKVTAGDVETYRLARLNEPSRGNGKALRGLLTLAAHLHKARLGKWVRGERRKRIATALSSLLPMYHPARIEEALSWWYGRADDLDLATLGADLEQRARENPAKIRVKPVSRRTPDVCLARLKRFFSLCVQWELTDRNPAAGVKLFKEDVKRCRYLSEEEEARLLEVCTPELRLVVTFAIHTGMRRGEILGLKWQDIDARNGVATIPGTRAKGKRDRYVPLNGTSLAILKALPQSIDRTALVFGNSEGGVWDRLRKQWVDAVALAGLEDFRFHDLRHTYASRLVMLGVDLAVLRELLGHRDFEMTLRYSHLSPSRLKEAVSLLCRDQNQHQTNIVQLNAEVFHRSPAGESA